MATLALDIPDHIDPSLVVDVDIYHVPGQVDDFHQAWKTLQQASPPVVWTPQNEGHWIALSGPVLAEVQSDHERFSNQIIVIPKSVGKLHQLIPTTIDPPEHRPYRKLLNSGMSLAKVRGLHETIRATAVELIEPFVARGRCDFTASYAQVFPISIFMALVGVPMAESGHIRYLAECMTRPNPPIPFEEAKQGFFDYLGPILDARRANPGEDLLSHIVTADIDGRQLSVEESLALATQVLIAGVDTVVNFLGFTMLHLARNPQLRKELAALDFPQVLAATNELFRRFGLVTIARTVRHDMDFHGASLKAGDLICIPTQVHGLDEMVNTDSLKVDLARKGCRHSAFGSGPHMCPGQELARAEVAITIAEWLRRIPDFHLAEDADPRCSAGIVGQINRVVLEW